MANQAGTIVSLIIFGTIGYFVYTFYQKNKTIFDLSKQELDRRRLEEEALKQEATQVSSAPVGASLTPSAAQIAAAISQLSATPTTTFTQIETHPDRIGIEFPAPALEITIEPDKPVEQTSELTRALLARQAQKEPTVSKLIGEIAQSMLTRATKGSAKKVVGVTLVSTPKSAAKPTPTTKPKASTVTIVKSTSPKSTTKAQTLKTATIIKSSSPSKATQKAVGVPPPKPKAPSPAPKVSKKPSKSG